MVAQLHNGLVLNARRISTGPGATAAFLSSQWFPEFGRIESGEVDKARTARVHAVPACPNRTYRAHLRGKDTAEAHFNVRRGAVRAAVIAGHQEVGGSGLRYAPGYPCLLGWRPTSSKPAAPRTCRRSRRSGSS